MLNRILFLLIIPTLLFAGEPLDKVVAIVNDSVITESELNQQVDIFRHELESKRMQLPDEVALRKQVLQHLIEVDIQLQVAKQNDVTVDNADLNNAIEKIASQNKLTLTQLRDAVSQQGMSWRWYRENIRKEMIINRLQQKAVGPDVAAVSKQQVEDYLKTAKEDEKMQQTYHLQNIVIPLSEEPTTEQLKKAEQKAKNILARLKKGEDFNRIALAESSGEFALDGGDLGERRLAELPEIFARQVVYMQVGEVAGPIRTGNGYQLIKLVAIGGNNQHHEVKKTLVRHILLKQGVRMTAEEAKKQANNIYLQLKAGKNFALMAKKYSHDTATAVKGGDLGWVSSGELVPAFEEAMDKLPLKQVSRPVKTPFGWHLIEVLERKSVDDSESFKRQQVRQFLQHRKFAEAVQNWQQHMKSQAYINIVDKQL